MAKSTDHTTTDALGCFVMLILGAIMTLGGMLVVIPRGIAVLLGGAATGWWKAAVAWVVAPAVGIAIAAWLTYSRRGPRAPRKRGKGGS
jgi:hypothetical protein